MSGIGVAISDVFWSIFGLLVGSLRIKDGSTTVDAVTEIDFAGAAVVSGSSPTAAVTVGFGHGAQTAVAGAATLNSRAGIITSESVSNVGTYTLTLTNSYIVTTSVIVVTPYTGGGEGQYIRGMTINNGSVVIIAQFATANLTGTIKFAFAVFN